MDENQLARRFIECKPEGVRRRGRRTLRWTDGVGRDLSKLGIKRTVDGR
jgi:hypothetical protein